MRDLKYIIKRVIIGVAIVLVLGFINNAKASALEDYSSYQGAITRTTISSSSVLQLIYTNNVTGSAKKEIYQDIQTGDIVFCVGNNDSNCRIFYVSQIPNFNYDKIGAIIYSYATTSINYDYIILSNESSLPKLNSVDPMHIETGYNYLVIRIHNKQNDASYISTHCSLYYANNEVYNTNINLSSQYRSYNSSVPWNYYSSSNANVNIENYYTSTPEFVSWNYQKIVNNNILLGYNFKPEFSNFDTTNYVYQYKIGSDTTTWLSLNENKQSIDVRGNTILYVRVKDLQNNIIDSATFTVSGVGSFTNNQNINYDIKFSGEYRTRDDLNYNESSGSAIIEEYQIYTDFIPNSSILKYQYQWVPTGGSLDSNSWVDINLEPTDYGDFTYVVNLNGTFYARILDSENNLKYSATFTVNTIGKLAIDSGNDKITNKFMSIADKLNIGGPISGLIEVPLKVINIISTGLAGGLTCTDYSLGSLWGTNLVIPCVNVKQHLGSSLYNTIDIIIACVMIFYIYKMIMNMYTNFVFMQKNPVQELGDRGD